MDAPLEAVGFLELNSIAVGFRTADAMVKASPVATLLVRTICPGKFLVGVHAQVAAVEAAVAAGLASAGAAVVDHCLIPNVSPAVVAALACAIQPAPGPALGVIETFSAAACVLAADAAAKAAAVDLIEVRLAMGLGGKAFCTLSGDVAAVEAAVAAGSAGAASAGLLVQSVVIPGLAAELYRHVM